MDVTIAITDPELGYTAFSVERITYTRSRTGTSKSSVISSASGSIHPGTPEMLQLLPEETRNDQLISVYTDFALSEGVPENAGGSAWTAPDRIIWSGKTWRVVRVRDWSMFGYYQGYAVLMKEEGV